MGMVKNFRNGIFKNRTRNRNRLKNVLTPEKLSEIKSKFEANGQTSVRKVSSQFCTFFYSEKFLGCFLLGTYCIYETCFMQYVSLIRNLPFFNITIFCLPFLPL